MGNLRQGIAQLVKVNRIDLYEGTGCIEAPHRVRVGEAVIEAERILIATGSVPALPPIEGIELAATSDDLLGAKAIPQSLVIVGGGVIGVEFASLLTMLGRSVSVIEALDRLLPPLDREFGQSVSMNLKKAGAQVHTGARVTRICRAEAGLRVEFEAKGKPGACEAETVLAAVGRRANTAGLFSEGFTVATERGRILVDERFETDVRASTPDWRRGGLAYSSRAACCARASPVWRASAGQKSGLRLDLIPSCVYTNPEIASVGLTADEAKAKGLEVKIGKVPMGANGRTQIAGGARGFVKVVVDAQTDVLLGAQMMCGRATDMIGEMNAAIANGLTRAQMLRAVRAHPDV